MNSVQIGATLIALALDMVRVYYKVNGLPDLNLHFSAASMTNPKHQNKIFQELLNQIVVLHNNSITASDTSELLSRLMTASLHMSNSDRVWTSQVLEMHKVDFTQIVNQDAKVFSKLNLGQEMLPHVVATRVVTPSPEAPFMSVLSQPLNAVIASNDSNEIVFDEQLQTFTALPTLTEEQWRRLVAKINGLGVAGLEGLEGVEASAELTDLEKVSLILMEDRVHRWRMTRE